MQYLNKATLKAIIYMLHNDNKIELSYFNNLRNKNIITDIKSFELQDVFSFKINNQYVDRNISKIKKIFSNITSEDSDARSVSLRKIAKALLDNSQDIDLVDLLNISGSIYYSFINNALILNPETSQKEKLDAFLDGYISNFKNNLLTAEKHNYYHFEENLSEMKKIMDLFQNKYGKRFVIQLPLNEKIKYGIYDKELRLIEILFYLLKKGYINIEGTKISKIKYQTSKEEYILNINITLKKSLAEIANIKNVVTIPEGTPETENLGNKVMFKLSYDDFSGEISINEKKLSQPQYDSVNRLVFEYLFNHPNQDVKVKELKEEIKELNNDLKKSLSKIANELGFVGDRKKLFFITTKNMARLRTEITKNQLQEARIEPLNILPQ